MLRKRRRSLGAVPDDVLEAIPSRVVSRRRKTRTRTITTLPDHVRDQLVTSFANIDIEGVGRVNRYKLVDIVREMYIPSDAEVLNVEKFIGQSSQADCVQKEDVDYDRFKTLFAAIVSPAITASPSMSFRNWDSFLGACVAHISGTDLIDSGSAAIFNTSITQLARDGKLPPGSDQDSHQQCHLQLYGAELQMLFESINNTTTSTNFVGAMVRQAFCPQRRTLDQLATLFNSREDETVELHEFIRAMTLLHGDMSHLVRSTSPPSEARLMRTKTLLHGEMDHLARPSSPPQTKLNSSSVSPFPSPDGIDEFGVSLDGSDEFGGSLDRTESTDRTDEFLSSDGNDSDEHVSSEASWNDQVNA